MQNIVSDKPYRFVPPYRSARWVGLLRSVLLRQARTRFGVTKIDVAAAEKLRASLDAGHGVILTPNHSRDSDPIVLGGLSKAVGAPFYLMASAHLFMQGSLQRWVLNRGGGFSVYREGMDRASVTAAAEILENAERPLVIFPEGFVSRTNERLNPFLEGVSFIARTAAKKRAKQSPPKKVVVHPVAIRYRFLGDEKALAAVLGPTLETIETRLSWRPQRDLPLAERVVKVGHALLAVKEVEYLGEPQPGDTRQRINRLVDRLLTPPEAEWLGGEREPLLIGRVKRLRTAILPEMVEGKLPPAEVERRWRQLADVYLAQSVSSYPGDYVAEDPTPERILQTVEAYEEDLTDRVTPHPPLLCTLTVGDAIEVNPGREARGQPDPLLAKVDASLRAMLGIKPDAATSRVPPATPAAPSGNGEAAPPAATESTPTPEAPPPAGEPAPASGAVG